MKVFVSILPLLWSLAAGSAFAQAYPPNEAGVTMGHWHLNSQQVEANKKLFVALGGTAGTVINHVGFIVPNVAEAVAKWKASGVAVAPGNAGRTDQAWIMTGEGLKVEIQIGRAHV